MEDAGTRRVDEDAALRAVVEATASATGDAFHQALVRNLSHALDTQGAWVTELLPNRTHMRALAFWFDGEWVPNFVYPIAGTPCERVVAENARIHIPDRIGGFHPGPVPAGFPKMPGGSFLGTPLYDAEHRIMGHLAVVDGRPMPADPRLFALFDIFAQRAGAEMLRMRLERELGERQEKLERLVGSAMDGIVELDDRLCVTLTNEAAEKIFGCPAASMRGEDVERLLGPVARGYVAALARELQEQSGGPRALWIPSGLVVEPAGGGSFPAEATLSCYELQGRLYYTLILRNVNERVAAQGRIHALSAQAEYLREEIAADHDFHDIVGRSPRLLAALRNVSKVAATDATVLLLGETGTGKELFARAIHDRSRRCQQPFIKVNCAAIPSTLIESEFFGHERGAFTGATQRREGRFALADRGTIFLDEIGELPLELQGKLLRVLQEGEFEPVGGSRTRKVDVRVLAATNRDLARAVKEGTFREDLYYRLNVFPLELPPLRDRGEDIVLIAREVLDRLARVIGRTLPPLSASDLDALRRYPWPGNVRELRNVMERALITSSGGRLDLERMLPATETPPAPPADAAAGPVLSAAQLRELERNNMIAALERAGWRVGGDQGAATLLGLSPSTFKSRMKALSIERNRRPGA